MNDLRTQLKAFYLQNLEELEPVINAWLLSQDDIIFQMLYILPVMRQNQPCTLAVVVYAREDWRSPEGAHHP